MKPFSNNQEFYDYLILLISRLHRRGFHDLAKPLEFAASQASSNSTEFLGESRIALRQLLDESPVHALTEAELNEVQYALSQLDTAFTKK